MIISAKEAKKIAEDKLSFNNITKKIFEIIRDCAEEGFFSVDVYIDSIKGLSDIKKDVIFYLEENLEYSVIDCSDFLTISWDI